jgi:hypothetical protein
MTSDPLTLAIRHVLTTERLTVLIGQATAMVEGISHVYDDDDELAPELKVALEGLNETVQALGRAHDFSKARLEVVTGNG